MMKTLFSPIVALAALAVIAAPAQAGPGSEQGQARREVKAGAVRSLREIEARVLPTMPGAQYLGPEYDSTTMVYRLKFVRGVRVIFVDVDARTGEVIRQSE